MMKPSVRRNWHSHPQRWSTTCWCGKVFDFFYWQNALGQALWYARKGCPHD